MMQYAYARRPHKVVCDNEGVPSCISNRGDRYSGLDLHMYVYAMPEGYYIHDVVYYFER